jgi:hypothetical protein
VGLDEANNNDNKKCGLLYLLLFQGGCFYLSITEESGEQCTLSINNIVGKGGRFANKFRKIAKP